MSKVKRIFKVLAGFFPRPLPVGVKAFNEWSADLIEVYKIADIMTVRDAQYTLAASIIGAGGSTAFKANFTFLLILRSAAAKQIAGAKFQEIQAELRAEQQARMEAQKQAEAAPVVALVDSKN